MVRAEGINLMDENLEELLSKCCAMLGEHSDSVLILISTQDKGKTTFTYEGRGNYYARLGMCHSFISKEDADALGEIIQPPPDDESESWKE